MEENNYCVYMHTLIQDGRKYVGITCQKPETRWGKNGNGYKNNQYFYRTIQKYGWDAFKHEILFSKLNQDQACLKEQALIKLFDTQNPEHGFNLTSGGIVCTLSNIAKEHQSTNGTIYAIDDEALYQLYIIENKTAQEIADILEVSVYAVRYRIHKLGLKKSQEQIKCNNAIGFKRYDIDDDQLTYLYLVENMSYKEIAEIMHVLPKAIRCRIRVLGLKKTMQQLSALRKRMRHN